MCGGTEPLLPQGPDHAGLSPRVRGNLLVRRGDAEKHGSIPACAGEPHCLGPEHRQRRVYPRVCGGTPEPPPTPLHATGLSPRVRGNLILAGPSGRLKRSIPACAGEPPPGRCSPRLLRVYPRVCGGTVPGAGEVGAGRGLSPRVRGNLGQACADAAATGSIPACAGEPSYYRVAHFWGRVYPRVCGGTRQRGDRSGGLRGLSPRVRGNRSGGAGVALVARSIPACAGEPR